MKKMISHLTALCACALAVIFFASCFALPVEEEVLPPPVIKAKNVRDYRTTTVVRGDVVRYTTTRANYRPRKEESHYFTVNDELIHAIYVNVGDTVNEGDILAEIDMTYVNNEIKKVEQDLAWARMTMAQLEERHAIDILEADITGRPVDDSVFSSQKDVILSSIESALEKLEKLDEEVEKRILRARIGGTVTRAMVYDHGMRSTTRQTNNRPFVVITDQTSAVFEVSMGMLTHEDFDPDIIYYIDVQWEPHAARIVSPDDIEISNPDPNRIYMILVGEDMPAVGENVFAQLKLVHSEVNDVLTIPRIALKQLEERTFVYVIENGLRTVHDIEVGLVGTINVEILSGLNEGDIVIME
ncbi:MAG: efflux RND transporter periplasmic adaptor subunit [Defluviitaleaceae bacterium]|nr:efflux RND transporter periplasmic adaptor subunit [Defluviitaleaceae bacterium]